MGEKRERKRIPITRSAASVEALKDPEEYTINMSSMNARPVSDQFENVNISLWFDKHYEDRNRFGDDNGVRDGIDREAVKALALASAKYLIYYSCVCPGFSFVNRLDPKVRTSPVRVICRRQTEAGMLNIAIEGHYKGINKYEITVVTAMCVDDFKAFDNQYVIDLSGGDPTLYRMVNKSLKEVLNT